MSNQIVFFGPVQTSRGGPVWRHFGSGTGGEIAFCLDEGLRIDPAETDPFRLALWVAQQLTHSPGCMITLAPPVNATITVKVRLGKGSESMGLAQAAMVIGPRGEAQSLELRDGAEVDLDIWESLIVPTWKAHEKKLKAFVETLGDLPDDYRVSMLYTLLQPTFEMRIARLEQLEAGPRKHVPSPLRQSWSRGGSGPLGFLEAVIIATCVVLLLGGALLVMDWNVRRLQDKVEDISSRLADNGAAQQSADPHPHKK